MNIEDIRRPIQRDGLSPHTFIPAVITNSFECCTLRVEICICKCPSGIEIYDAAYTNGGSANIAYGSEILSIWERILLFIYLSLSWRKIKHPTFRL